MKTGRRTGVPDPVISSLYPADITWQRDPDDRRRRRRVPLAARVRFETLGKKAPRISGDGWTENISSCGILFTTPHPLTPGDQVAVYVEWPARQEDRYPMELATLARVVRRGEGKAAVEILQFEFRRADRESGTGPDD